MNNLTERQDAASAEIRAAISDMAKEMAKLRLENLALKQQIEALQPKPDVYLWPEFGGEV